MSKYKKPVLFTVELACPGAPNLEWQFAPVAEGQARELYHCLIRTRAVMRTRQHDEVDGRYAIGVNLVAWDRHPGQTDAEGLILAQDGWESE